jgi:hypothetical protein
VLGLPQLRIDVRRMLMTNSGGSMEDADVTPEFNPETGERWKKLVAERVALERSIRPQIDAIRASIEPRASEVDRLIDEIEGEHGNMEECEFCDRAEPVEMMTCTDNGWACSACISTWQAEYDACAHEFKDGVCTKCAGDHPDVRMQDI